MTIEARLSARVRRASIRGSIGVRTQSGPPRRANVIFARSSPAMPECGVCTDDKPACFACAHCKYLACAQCTGTWFESQQVR